MCMHNTYQKTIAVYETRCSAMIKSPQTLIFESLHLCNPLTYTLDISCHVFGWIKLSKFEISKVYTIRYKQFEFVAKLNSFIQFFVVACTDKLPSYRSNFELLLRASWMETLNFMISFQKLRSWVMRGLSLVMILNGSMI